MNSFNVFSVGNQLKFTFGIALLSTFYWAEPAAAFKLKASAGLSQFGTPTTQVYDSSMPTSSGPKAEVALEDTDGLPKVSAAVSPKRLNVELETANSGIGRPFAQASAEDRNVVFHNPLSLQTLIDPTTNYVDLLLNFNVDYSLSVQTQPGLFNQSASFVGVTFSSPFSPERTIGGGAQSVTGHRSHGFSNEGIFEGFPEQGGSTVARLPIRISSTHLSNPQNLNDSGELFLPFNLNARVSGLALPGGFSNGQVAVEIPKFSSFITTTIGAPVNNFGVSYDLIPTISTPSTPDSTKVPTPALLPGLIGVAFSAIRKRKREQQI